MLMLKMLAEGLPGRSPKVIDQQVRKLWKLSVLGLDHGNGRWMISQEPGDINKAKTVDVPGVLSKVKVSVPGLA